VPTDCLQLRPLFEATATTETTTEVQGTPRGTLRVVEFATFDCTGDRFVAALNPTSSAEWTVTAPDGTSTAEGRLALATNANESVYMRWVARWDASAHGPTPPRLVAMFEANGDLAWLNKVVATGLVRQNGSDRRYELFELTLDAGIGGGTPASAPILEPLFVLDNTVDVTNAVSLPGTTAGHRLIGAVTAADCRGPRIRARLRGRAAGDWATLSPEGSVVIDVVETLETDDGALVHLSYRGSADVSAGPYSAPSYVIGLFETGDQHYAWLNAALAVGEGRHEVAEVVSYHFYEFR
jgi:hypothetical protein